jgi:putative ABC transport system permease protein
VLGHDLAHQLLGDDSPLPAPIRIGPIRYKAVGVARKKAAGSVLDGNDDDKVFVPFHSMQRDFPLHSPEEGAGAALVVQPVSADLHEWIIRDVRRILAARHGFDAADPDALTLIDTVATARTVQKVFSGLALFSDVSSLMTVAMAAIGLTNILLISVRERTREIGIRRSVGARRRHIFTQFVGEGLILSSVGGLLGLIAGAGLALLLGMLPIPGFSRPVVRVAPALAACAVIIATGLAASVYPAWRAVRTDPVEAIRRG